MYFGHFPAIVALICLVALLNTSSSFGQDVGTTTAATSTAADASTTTVPPATTSTAADASTTTVPPATTSTSASGVTSSTLGSNANSTIQTTTHSGTVNIQIGFLCILPLLLISMATLF